MAGGFKGRKLAFVGDGNNVVHSLLYACAKVGLNFYIATPKRYSPDDIIFKQAREAAGSSGAEIVLLDDPKEAVKDADFVYTDVWASMGQEKEAARRKRVFRGFTVDKNLVSLAKKGCKIMHCLPAHRGEEITDEVIDSKNSIVFDEAENRLHVQKAILLWLLSEK